MNIMQTYCGDRYEVTLIAYDNDDIHGEFEIRAKHINTGRCSSVTNNNHIIAEFIEPITGDTDVEDSIYICNDRQQFERLVAHALDLLKQGVNKHLEIAFDDDRDAGEWGKHSEIIFVPERGRSKV